MTWIRCGAILFALVQISTYYLPYPEHTQATAYIGTGIFALASLLLYLLRGSLSLTTSAITGIALDSAFALFLTFIYTFDVNTAIFIVLYLPALEAAMLFGMRAALATSLGIAVAYTAREAWGAMHWDGYADQNYPFLPVSISFRMGVGLLIALVAGAMARSFDREREARDQLTAAEIAQARTLRRMMALKSNLVSGVSHELRTPLTSVIGFADTLQRRLPDVPPAEREMFYHLLTQAERLGDLVEQLTDLNYLDERALKLDSVDIAELAREVAGNVANPHRVRVEAQDIATAAFADRRQLARALSCLVSNALRYSDEDVHLAITSEKRSGRDGLCMRVIDAGPGIALSERERVFAAFERAHEPYEPSPGMGVGLTLARTIALGHGGDLAVEDRTDGHSGAVLALWLPAAA